MPPLAGFLFKLLPCRSLRSFKLRCFTLLVMGLATDIGIKVAVNWPELNVEISDPEITIVIVVSVAMIFLVIVDAILEDRRRKFALQLQNLLSNPEVPDNVKEDIAKALR